jgi:glycosyltransferase involved in cell wall biosynthesis
MRIHQNTVAVVIPAYNASATISKSLQSVFAQSKLPEEIIVVDDGSTDGTVEIVHSFGSSVKLVKSPHLGVAAARNRGVRESRCDWIAFLDADDIWMRDKLELQFRVVQDESTLVYTDAIVVSGTDRWVLSGVATCYEGHVLEQLLLGNFITNSSVIVRKAVFQALGGYPEHLRAIVDWPLWLKISAAHAVQYVNKPLVEYRVSEGGITRRIEVTMPAHLAVLDEAFSDLGPAAHLRHFRSEAYARAYRVVACEAARARRWTAAFSLLSRSLWYFPTELTSYKLLLKAALAGTGVRAW